MRVMLAALVNLSFFLLDPSGLQAQDDLRAVIDKAIKAHGGEANLDKHKASQTKTKGKVEREGNTIDFVEEVTLHLPNKFKSVSEFEFMGAHKIIVGFDGSQAWLNADGNDISMMFDKLTDLMKEQAYILEAARLSKLKDKRFELTSLGESKVQDKPAMGVRVGSKGHMDLNLYFDKNSGLLVKVEYRTLDLASNQEINEERIITEYQDKDGMKVPKKAIVNRDGKKYLEVEVVEVKFLNDIDDTQFSKP